MKDYRINQHYAKALLMLAEERGDADRVSEDMRLAAQVCAENRVLTTFLANPTMPAARKVAIIDELFRPHVSETTLAFLLFVVRKRRGIALRGIAEAYLEQWRERRGIVLSHLVTHQPVTLEAQEGVRHLVKDYTGKEVELHAFTDAKMLGSFKLEFDNKMYDARLRTKIRKLRIAFAKNEYESQL